MSVEIERMTRGPAKVSVRVDGEDIDAVAMEALAVYQNMVESLDRLDRTGFSDEEK